MSILRPSPADEALVVNDEAPRAPADTPEPATAVAEPAEEAVAVEPESAAEEPAAAKAEAAPAAEVKPTSSSATRFAKQFKIPETLANQIHSAAVSEGIEPRVAFGLVQVESSFRRTAISSVGAVGYTQLLPSTARWIAPGTTRSQLFHPPTNLRVGFKYLNYLKKKYNGNMRLALTAYNRGPGTVDRILKQGRNPENGYATKVLRGRA
jgi:soluble lytic murein transglycosylase-like protein